MRKREKQTLKVIAKKNALTESRNAMTTLKLLNSAHGLIYLFLTFSYDSLNKDSVHLWTLVHVVVYRVLN